MAFPKSSFARSGRFTTIQPLGRGAAGQVYAAVDNLGRRVAVKELLPGAEGFAVFRAKFEKEARLQAALDHPNIVRVYHLEEDPETHELYLICEYADGGSLADLLEQRGPLSEAEAIGFALDLCAALEETERQKIVHRDVKPSNILLFKRQGDGLTAKLGDFGIAQDTRLRKTTMLPNSSHPGTPHYMAPEQADVTVILDTRADLFALGVTLWEMLTREDYKALLRDGAAPTLQHYSPRASLQIAQVIERAVRTSREERYQTPRELADDLRRTLAGEPLAPLTVRVVPQARYRQEVPSTRHNKAPLARLGAWGPLAMTLGLLMGSWLVTAALYGISGLMAGRAAGNGSMEVIVETVVPSMVPGMGSTIPTTTPISTVVQGQVELPPVLPSPTVIFEGTTQAVSGPPRDIPPPTDIPQRADTAQAAGNPACVAGSGTVTSESRPVANVRSVLMTGQGLVEIRQGDNEALTVTADNNLLPLLTTEQRGDELVLGLTECVRDTREIRFTLIVRDLRALSITGTADARLEQFNVENLTLTISGTGRIDASGSARQLAVTISGAGDVRGHALSSRDARVRIDGAGTVALFATGTLDVNIAGVGTVIPLGSPTITRSITGVGSIQGVGAP